MNSGPWDNGFRFHEDRPSPRIRSMHVWRRQQAYRAEVLVICQESVRGLARAVGDMGSKSSWEIRVHNGGKEVCETPRPTMVTNGDPLPVWTMV